ncbi:hypothetical protein M0804_010620 [Polistes exclamans]|nr:hypothetical protein M0804_010620 [Polistes exclamans]
MLDYVGIPMTGVGEEKEEEEGAGGGEVVMVEKEEKISYDPTSYVRNRKNAFAIVDDVVAPGLLIDESYVEDARRENNIKSRRREGKRKEEKNSSSSSSSWSFC